VSVFGEFYQNFRLIEGWQGVKENWFPVLGIAILLVAASGWVQQQSNELGTQADLGKNASLAWQFKALVD